MGNLMAEKQKFDLDPTTSTREEYRHAAKAIALDLLKSEDEGKVNNIKDIFNTWDSDGNGVIDIVEFMSGLKSLGYSFSNQIGIGIFSIFDINRDMTIHYWELVRVLHELAHDEVSLASDEAIQKNYRNETKYEKDHQDKISNYYTDRSEDFNVSDKLSDKEVLKMISSRIYERGLSSHTLIRKLVPECTGGKLDIAGLDKLLKKLGFRLTPSHLKRIMQKADILHNGKLASWELVRLLGQED